jgi:hypothetical protein
VKVSFLSDAAIYSKKDTWGFSLSNTDSNDALMSKNDASDNELNRLGERMPIGQYVDLSISSAREEREEIILGMPGDTDFDMLNLKKISFRRVKPM